MLLHWSVALLVLAATGLALFRESFARLSIDMITLHKQIGLAVLAAAAVRLGWRLFHPPPPLPPSIGRGERRLAGAVHRLIYTLLIAVPLTGWLFISYAPIARPLDYRGHESVLDLPLPPDDALSFAWHEAHELAGFALIGLVILHLAGVVRHQLGARDRLFQRMARPGWPLLLGRLALVAALLWLVGLLLDLGAVRLMGQPLA